MAAKITRLLQPASSRPSQHAVVAPLRAIKSFVPGITRDNSGIPGMPTRVGATTSGRLRFGLRSPNRRPPLSADAPKPGPRNPVRETILCTLAAALPRPRLVFFGTLPRSAAIT